MITFHPAARQTTQGFIPMVTLRAAKGRMVGSKVSQTGNVFATAGEALEAAVVAARRVAASSFVHQGRGVMRRTSKERRSLILAQALAALDALKLS